jgi:hypothetical protein
MNEELSDLILGLIIEELVADGGPNDRSATFSTVE